MVTMKIRALFLKTCCGILFCSLPFSQVNSQTPQRLLEEESVFSGRIVRVNEQASLLRVAVDFENAKYLNRRDQVEFWHEREPKRRCRAVLAGKSAGEFLFRIPDFKFCNRSVALNWGDYMVFQSEDLANNMAMGREVVGILLTKRLALKSRLNEREKELQSHIERVNAINERYETLRMKLEGEWQAELAAIEEDRAESVRQYEDLKIRLNELSYKLERYRVNDENLKEDRWALDPLMYYKK